MTISWKSEPDYDEWGWDSYWSCHDWKLWYIELVKHYGGKQGSEIWLEAWFNSDYDTWLIENTDWCGYDEDFVSHFKKYNIDLSNSLSRNIEGVKKLFSSAADGLGLLFKVLPLALVGIVSYKFYKEFES